MIYENKQRRGMGDVEDLGREAGFSAAAASAPPPVEMTFLGWVRC